MTRGVWKQPARGRGQWRTALGAASLVFVALLVGAQKGDAQAAAQDGGAAPAPLSVHKGKEYTLEKWAEGVYLATGGTGSQNCVIVNDDDVVLFDVGTTPAGARALLEDIRLVTDKPVRTVVNSHFHYDHVLGNGAFGPDVQIIGHRYTRTAIQTFDTLHREPYLSWINRHNPAQLEAMAKQLAGETSAQRRASLEAQLAATRLNMERVAEISPVPPNLTFDSEMVLTRGTRDIRLLFLGRGHTAGDIVLHLPKEGVVCTGDLMEGVIAYLGDGFFDEWVKTLQALKTLDFGLVLPGHGRPFSDKQRITHFESYLTDLVTQVEAIRSRGVPAEEALRQVDMSAHEKNWAPRLRPLDLRSMRRVYQWLEERAAR